MPDKAEFAERRRFLASIGTGLLILKPGSGGPVVTWDEMMRSDEKLDYRLEGLA